MLKGLHLLGGRDEIFFWVIQNFTLCLEVRGGKRSRMSELNGAFSIHIPIFLNVLSLYLEIFLCTPQVLSVSNSISSDLALLWLWHRPAATAPIGPLAWEPPYATGAAPEKAKKQKKKQQKKEFQHTNFGEGGTQTFRP